MSKLLPVTTGVPQGSILGPLLYTIFTNELPAVTKFQEEVSNEDSVCCYADDTTLSCSAKTADDLTNKLENQFKAVTKFLVSNGF